MNSDFSFLSSEFSFQFRKEDYLFLSKYWLESHEYNEIYYPIQKLIFNNANEFNSIYPFNNNYKVIPSPGGISFEQSDYNSLLNCISDFDDDYFVMIEQNPENQKRRLKFKFSKILFWMDIEHQNQIANELFRFPRRNYYVFDKSANWGKFVGNDFSYPVNFIGFRACFEEKFINEFSLNEENMSVLKSCAEDIYIAYIGK